MKTQTMFDAAADLVAATYESGHMGGYAHVVVDDQNLEDHWLDDCIKSAAGDDKYEFGEEHRQVALACLSLLRLFNERSRMGVIRKGHAIAEAQGWR